MGSGIENIPAQKVAMIAASIRKEESQRKGIDRMRRPHKKSRRSSVQISRNGLTRISCEGSNLSLRQAKSPSIHPNAVTRQWLSSIHPTAATRQEAA